MGLGDGGDDRQAEAGAAVADAGGAAEALEGVLEEGGREALAFVGDVDLDRVAVGARGRERRSSRRRSGARCRPGCRSPGRGAGGRRRGSISPPSPTSIRRPASSARRAKRRSTASKVSPRRSGSRRSGSSPRSVWAIVSRSSESWVRRSVSSAAEARAARSSSGRAALGERQLELGAEDRQRRAQLVAGVGDEGALALQRVAEPGQHLVQRLAQARDLVAGVGDGQALVRRRRWRSPRPGRASPRPGGAPRWRPRSRRSRRGSGRAGRPISSSCSRSVTDSSRPAVEAPTTTIRLPAAVPAPGPRAGATPPSRPGSGAAVDEDLGSGGRRAAGRASAGRRRRSPARSR